MTEAAPKLEIRALGKVFPRGESGVQALDKINITVESGEFVSLVGASGCGKTTLLRIVDGLMAPTTGSILIDGHEVAGPGPERAFVFQHDALFPWRDVNTNALLGPELNGTPPSRALPLRDRFLRMVGLDGFGGHYPHELSGGMRQRVNLARALTVDPDILLMDEPFASLDAQTREIMQSELLRIWTEAKKTVLFVTHGIDEAVYLSDRVLVLTARPGRLKESITIDLPRPRELSVKRTAPFAEYVDYIWRLIEEEVRASMQWHAPAVA